MSVAVTKNAVLKSLQSLKGEHPARSRSSSPARAAQALSCPSSPARDCISGSARGRSGRGTPSPDPVRASGPSTPTSTASTSFVHVLHADAVSRLRPSSPDPWIPAASHPPSHDPPHGVSILDMDTLAPSQPPECCQQRQALKPQPRAASSPCFPTSASHPLLHSHAHATAAEENGQCSSSSSSSSSSSRSNLQEDESRAEPPAAEAAPAPAPAADPSPASLPLSAAHMHLIKILARGGADVLKVAQMLQSPLDGIANIAADSGSELLLKRVAAASAAAAALSPAGAAGAAPVVLEYNPVHARVLSVVLSALLSTAGAQSVGLELPGLPFLAPGPGAQVEMTAPAALAERLAPVASMAPAPALKASDADDAIGAGTLAASAGIRKLMRAGSDARAVLPDLSNILDGVLGSVHDSIDEMDSTVHLPSAQQLLQRHSILGRHAGDSSSAASHGAVGDAELGLAL